MTCNNEQQHMSTLLSSIERNYNQAKLGKSIKAHDIYLYDILYNLLEGCCITLSNSQKLQLQKLYNKLPSISKEVCLSFVQQDFQMTNSKMFTQREHKDCYNDNNYDKVYVWQDDDINNTSTDIYNDTLNESFFIGRDFYLLNEVNQGFTMTLPNIGKIAFLIIDAGDISFNIIDVLQNDVTDAFTRIYNATTEDVLYVSNNNFTHSTMKFKIQPQ